LNLDALTPGAEEFSTVIAPAAVLEARP
jgi:hypothetical protein